MPNINSIPHNIHMSKEQTAMLPTLRAKSNMNKSELVRYGLFLVALEMGIEFPIDGEPGGVASTGTIKTPQSK